MERKPKNSASVLLRAMRSLILLMEARTPAEFAGQLPEQCVVARFKAALQGNTKTAGNVNFIRE